MGRQVFFGIKAQLSLVVCVVAMFCLAVLSIATYVSNHNTVLHLRFDRLSVIAELKAAQVSQAIYALMGQAVMLSSRSFMQNIIAQSQGGAVMIGQDADDVQEFKLAVESTDDVVAATVYDQNLNQVVFVKSNDTSENDITLPDDLYPALSENVSEVTDKTNGVNGYLMGPYLSDSRYYVSVTRRLTQNTPQSDGYNITRNTVPQGATIGFLTAVMKADPLTSVVIRTDRLGNRSMTALVELTPINSTNVSSTTAAAASASSTVPTDMTYVLAGPDVNVTERTVPLESYTKKMLLGQASGAEVNGIDFNGQTDLSVGYSSVDVSGRLWGVLIYQTHNEVYQPLYELRNMILISVFTIGLAMFVAALLLSGWIVRPIKRLQAATEEANPFLAEAKTPVRLWNKPWVKRGPDSGGGSGSGGAGSSQLSKISKYGVSALFMHYVFRKKLPENRYGMNTDNEGEFQIPERVMTRRRIKDELTDLTETFNEMTDELRKQYRTLEDRVVQKTQEIESARISAEQANEAKSLFIANITHELRTPLNGVLGMASVAMEQDDPEQIKASLGVIFKSGELLLHLLTDLLSFSKSNIGNNMKLDEKELIIQEIMMQLGAIFTEQSRRSQIDLTVELLSPMLKDVVLYGDINRILQIVINLMSNSLKFTPKGGKVWCKITSEYKPCPTKSVGEYSEDTIGSLPPPHLPSHSHFGTSGGESSVEGSSTFTRASLSTKTSSYNVASSHDEDKDKENGKENGNGGHSVHYSVTERSDSYGEDDDEREEDSDDDGNDDDDDDNLPAEYGGYDIMTVSFEVSDTGPGIAPHLQARIFEPFVQGDLQFSERRVGAGLGLSICKQLASLMHGSVTMQSELGKGSTFTFKVPLRVIKNGSKSAATTDWHAVDDWVAYEYEPELKEKLADGDTSGGGTSSTGGTPGTEYAPLMPPKRPPISRNPSSMGSSNGGANQEDRKIPFSVKVLVAEDNKVNQEVMVRMLKLEGIEDVVIANDGLEAVNRVRESAQEQPPFDIIFMDIQMPNLDGLQATTVIRQEIEFEGPIVAVSAFAEQSNVEKCRQVGITQFLAKPLRRPHLHRLLLDVLCSGKTGTQEEDGDAP